MFYIKKKLTDLTFINALSVITLKAANVMIDSPENIPLRILFKI